MVPVVLSLCGLGLVDGGPLGGELDWAELPVDGEGSVAVVVSPPVVDGTRASRRLSNCHRLSSSLRN